MSHPRKKRRKAATKKNVVSPHCPKCGGAAIKSGMVQGKQRWKCKACRYQYTRMAPRGRPLWQKSLVVFLYSYGLSMHAIGRIFHVRPSTVLKWVRGYADDRRLPEEGDIAIMNLPDLRRRLKTTGNQDANMLCIAIDDAIFRESLGIRITRR